MLIALTFDDGPFDHTGALLDILKELDVLATFFVMGKNMASYPAQARQIHEAGHEIANHTWNHNPMGDANLDEIREEIATSSAVIREITGQDPAFFRAPNLNHGANLSEVAAEMGLPIISADSISRDWEDIDAAQVVENVLNSASDGSIVLLHEQWNAANRRTMDALPTIVAELRAKGFEFVTLAELVERRGATLQPGQVYTSVR